MKRIDTMAHLREEISRLKTLSAEQEKQLKLDVQGVREDLKPTNILLNAIARMTGIKFHKAEFVREGFLYGLSMLSQRFAIKTEKKVEEMVYHVVDTLIEKIQDFVNRHTGHDAKREERTATRDESKPSAS